ncbi:uncharacterized protein RHIMIDRAFT_263043 [Rhizopus microsporus ATCC 52813]|uniref:Uncharacterized protein n=1 Tax=Rhizopus microsporus ATCC 52813 TaxID=1340429 RepID=A0A2G4SL86_RHIZD|nr:uncharacterized protein RHIMIDRAFT_263043 [Rhizopus microsporus ATCC 52813]PHZ09530.1 hypothetical protein RHIMIDRAFT_263043 [Rhizopus microsporus ATCC 52813]
MSDQAIELSSAPFAPHSNIKKRKTTHNGSSQQPSSFEHELLALNEHMDLDIKVENTEAAWARPPPPPIDPSKDSIGNYK